MSLSRAGVYMRPADIMPGYPYSKSFRAMASGWVWDEDALDGWLTSTQDFIRGSTMFPKVEEPVRDRGGDSDGTGITVPKS